MDDEQPLVKGSVCRATYNMVGVPGRGV